MQKDNLAARVLDEYFSKKLDIRVQAFNLLLFIGIIGGMMAAVISAVIKLNIAIVLINFMIAVLAFTLLQTAQKYKCYHLCSWVIVIAVFFVGFPAIFFFGGGYKSGVGYGFMIAMIFTVILLEKRQQAVALTLELMIYVFCFLISYYYKENLVIVLSEWNYILVAMLNFITCGIILLVVYKMNTRMFFNRQDEMEELNRELVARNKTLAQYDNMKSDFLATVAHEIVTPLAVISASSNDTIDLLEESPLNLDEIRENQVVIDRRVRLIDSILLDLMDTVAIENGRLSLNRLPVDLSELIQNICNSQHKALDVNHNQLEYDLQEDLPQIWADQLRIEQVMSNLLANAFHHTQSGVITIKLVQKDNYQVVSVQDTGAGMDEEMARVALKQYVSAKKDYWRHGIGLYISRRIITAHGGDIWIESEKGRGTTISFRLMEEPDYEIMESLDLNH